MSRSNRTQPRVIAGRATLPAVLAICTLFWLLAGWLQPSLPAAPGGGVADEVLSLLPLPAWLGRMLNFALYLLMGYLLIGLNNTFAFIRLRASIPAAVFLLLYGTCPWLHPLQAGSGAGVAVLLSLFFQLHSYRRSRPMGWLFHTFLFLGIGSLAVPQVTWLAPIYWIGAYQFRSLTTRSFLASLVGWAVPWWFVLGHAYFYGQMELFTAPMEQIASFVSPLQDFEPWQIGLLCYIIILYVVSAWHCAVSVHIDNLRIRHYLNFLTELTFYMLMMLILQPRLITPLLSLPMASTAILAGHLLVWTGGRRGIIFLTVMLILLCTLFIFQLGIIPQSLLPWMR